VSETVHVSVVVPSHNGSGLLPRTLSHIAAQRVPADLSWELILVDNASTDGAAEVAAAAWPADAPVELGDVREPRLGLAHAHARGFSEAKGELITWVEDDNWIAPDWVETVWRTMQENPAVGACGGFNEALCEGGEPPWFEAFQAIYASGPQGRARGDHTDEPTFLWGAGMTVRRAAWHDLIDRGFRPHVGDREGKANHGGGEDVEISCALRLAGWRLWFEPRLQMRHYLARHRLTWPYLRRHARGMGAASVGLDSYRRALGEPLSGDLRGSWSAETRSILSQLGRERGRLWKMLRSPCEGDADELALEVRIGRLAQLLRQRRSYDRGFVALANATWRRPQPSIPQFDRPPG
jgi:glycosyltransferase involved in cell wall biosynthesis